MGKCAWDIEGHETTQGGTDRQSHEYPRAMCHRASRYRDKRGCAHPVDDDDEAFATAESDDVAAGIVITETWVKTTPLSDV
jgi:hypothetical protein